MAAAAGFGFLLTGFVVAMGSAHNASAYSSDEILLLANAAEQRGQYETAIERLQELEGRIDAPAEHAAIAKRIAALRGAQTGAALGQAR